MTILTCKDLTSGYEGIPVFEHLSFSLEEGSYLCVIGENGSGKTTFLKTLLGILKPMSGTITFSEDLNGRIGYVPQQSAVQRDFPASVSEVVLSGCISRPGFRFFMQKKDRETADAKMEQMGITHLKQKSFQELSGGQQQRVLLARALCAADRLLVLDEPVTGLDPETTAQMYRMISDLHASGMAVIMITHDLSAAKRYGQYILSFGEDVRFETKEEFFGGQSDAE